MVRHALRHRLRVIRVIARFAVGRPEVRHAHAALLQVLLQRLFEFVAAVIRPDGNGRRPATPLPCPRLAVLDERQQRHDPLLQLVTAIEIDLVRTPNGIADVLLERMQRLIELAQQKRLFRRLRIQRHHRVNMAVGHAEDIIRLPHQVRGQHPAAQSRDIDPQLLGGLHRVGARRRALDRAQARRHHAVLSASLGGLAENAFGHRAAAHVSGANEKDRLHSAML